MSLTKKKKKILSGMDLSKTYEITEAVESIKSYASKKFDESFDLSVVLGIDAKKTDQLVRGVISLPKSMGKKVKVAAFVGDGEIESAKKAGADIVANDQLFEDIKKGKVEFDKCVSTPEMMAKVGSLGQILGPKGIMPNPKLGTVTKNFEEAIKNIKSGQIEFKTDKSGIVHVAIAKVSFKGDEIINNIKFFYKELNKTKPSSSKGVFIKKIFLSSTMGPGLKIDLNSVI